MTLDFFLKHYDLSEYTINKVYIKNNKLYLDMTMPIHLDLIANGYRPELDMMSKCVFVFYVEHFDKKFTPNSLIEFNKEYVYINNEEIKITLSQVDILEQK